MRLKLAFVCIGSALSLWGADDIVKIVRGQQPVSILARKDVADLPFWAKDKLLLAVSPEYKALPPAEAFGLLRKEGRAYAASVGLKPLKEVVWYEGCKECGHFYERGRQHLTLRYGPLTLVVSVGQFEKYVDSWVRASLAEDSKISIDVLTRNIRFAEVDPRVLLAESAPLKDVAKTVQHGARWKSALIAGLGGMATRTVTVDQTGDFQGSYNDSGGRGSFRGDYSGRATIQEPDREARAKAQVKAAEVVKHAQVRSAGVLDTALLDTTLGPGQAVDGFIYFKRDKAMRSGVLQIKIGNIGFEFPVRWQ